jgi:hypothetical protein
MRLRWGTIRYAAGRGAEQAPAARLAGDGDAARESGGRLTRRRAAAFAKRSLVPAPDATGKRIWPESL